MLLLIIAAVAGLAAALEPARLLLGRQAIKAARQEDVPAVTKALAEWRSPSLQKRK